MCPTRRALFSICIDRNGFPEYCVIDVFEGDKIVDHHFTDISDGGPELSFDEVIWELYGDRARVAELAQVLPLE
jgi:hypothetical protein